jgi:hypothetical protein
MKGKKQILKRTDDLTVAEVKSCTVFAHFTDEQAMDVVSNFKRFSVIIYDLFQRNERKNSLIKD